MPVMDHALSKDVELREIWSAIWTAVDEALVSNGVAAMSAIRKQKAITWALQLSRAFAVTISSEPTSSGKPPKKPPSPKRPLAEDDEDEDELESVPVNISVQCQKDMIDQGASRPADLSRMYLSCHVGRCAGRDEHSGLGYSSYWSMAKALKHVAKNPNTVGSKNLPPLLEAAKQTGDLTALDKFVWKTSDGFMVYATDSFWVAGGSRLLRR